MKIKKIKNVGKKPVYDLSINTENYNDQHYVLENGVVSHNTGIYYSSDNIWIIGRQQNKVGTEIQGYHFVINVEKSRYVKEKSKIPISVSWEGGIEKYSGLLDVALAGGYISKPSVGWYQRTDTDGNLIGNKFREKDSYSPELWNDIFENTDFKEFVKKHYTIGHRSMFNTEDFALQEGENEV